VVIETLIVTSGVVVVASLALTRSILSGRRDALLRRTHATFLKAYEKAETPDDRRLIAEQFGQTYRAIAEAENEASLPRSP